LKKVRVRSFIQSQVIARRHQRAQIPQNIEDLVSNICYIIEDNEEIKTPITKNNELHETDSLEKIVISGLTEHNLLIELHIQNCECKGWILENLHNLKARKLSLCNIKNFLLDYDDYSNAFSMKSFADKDLKRMVSSPLVSLRLSIILIYTIRKMQFD